MNLQDIIINAGVGFLTGFGLGVSGATTRIRERAEYLEAIYPHLTEEKQKEVKLDSFDKLRSIEKKGEKILPSLAGICFPLITRVTDQDSYAFLESAVAAIPSSYVGLFAGKALRKVLRKRTREEIEITRKMTEDPENALNYIPEGRRETIEKIINEAEELALKGKFNSSMKNDPFYPFIDIYGAVHSGKIYDQALFAWSQRKISEISDIGNLRNDLEGFFKESPLGSAGILGNPEYFRIKIIDIGEDKRLRVYNLELSEAKVITIDDPTEGVERKTIETRGRVKLSLDESKIWNGEIWNGEYSDLTRYVLNSMGSYSIVVMKSHEGATEEMKVGLAIDCFAEEYNPNLK